MSTLIDYFMNAIIRRNGSNPFPPDHLKSYFFIIRVEFLITKSLGQREYFLLPGGEMVTQLALNQPRIGSTPIWATIRVWCSDNTLVSKTEAGGLIPSTCAKIDK